MNANQAERNRADNKGLGGQAARRKRQAELERKKRIETGKTKGPTVFSDMGDADAVGVGEGK